MHVQNIQASLIVFAVDTLSLASETWGKREIDRLRRPRQAQPAKQSQTGPQDFSFGKWEGWEKRRHSPAPCFKGKALGTRLEKRAFITRRVCLVPLRRFPRPSRSIHFGDVSEANGRETELTSSLGPRDPKRIGLAD